MASRDEQFSSVANRRLPKQGRLKDTAAALKKVALRTDLGKHSPRNILSPRRVMTPSHCDIRSNNNNKIRTSGTNTGNNNSPDNSFVTCMSRPESFITARSGTNDNGSFITAKSRESQFIMK